MIKFIKNYGLYVFETLFGYVFWICLLFITSIYIKNLYNLS